MERDIIDDLELDNDEARETALERGLLEHGDALFNGKPIRAITAGSMAIMQRTKNGLIFGDSSNLLFDAASFVILHTDDEDSFKAARRAAFGQDWPGYVIDWLDSTVDAQAKLTVFAPTIARLMNDYGSALTRSLESTKSGNAGGHIG